MKLPLTDAQVERAAREYCRLMRMDPDERIALPHDGGPHMVQRYGQRWESYEHAVRSAAVMRCALEFIERPQE